MFGSGGLWRPHVGDHRLTQRRVGRREHDREHERLRHVSRVRTAAATTVPATMVSGRPIRAAAQEGDSPGGPRSVDPRRIREEHERQRRLGERGRLALDLKV